MHLFPYLICDRGLGLCLARHADDTVYLGKLRRGIESVSRTEDSMLENYMKWNILLASPGTAGFVGDSIAVLLSDDKEEVKSWFSVVNAQRLVNEIMMSSQSLVLLERFESEFSVRNPSSKFTGTGMMLVFSKLQSFTLDVPVGSTRHVNCCGMTLNDYLRYVLQELTQMKLKLHKPTTWRLSSIGALKCIPTFRYVKSMQFSSSWKTYPSTCWLYWIVAGNCT